MKNPFARKKTEENVNNVEYIVNEQPEEIHIEATEPRQTPDDAPTIGIETIKDVQYEDIPEDDDEEEYVYVTPHYTLNRIIKFIFQITHSGLLHTQVPESPSSRQA